ncbi:DUF2786 domain-containing protein [Corynebacterium camporealensis]
MTSTHALYSAVIDTVIYCARIGWTPQDILHVVGPKAAPFIFRASPRVPARITSPFLRKAWISFPPPTNTSMTRADARVVGKALRNMAVLRDTELLSGVQNDSAPEKSKYHKKIRNLLAKAESTQFSDEADSLIAKAQLLQQRYRIDDVLNDDAPDVIARRVHISAPYIKHQTLLLSVVADANACTSLLMHDQGLATVIGAPDDVEHTIDLFASLNRQCDWYMRHGEGAEVARFTRSTSSYRRSFRLAYAGRIAELLQEANAEAVQEATAEAGPKSSTTAKDEPSFDDGADENSVNQSKDFLPALQQRALRAEETRDRIFPNLKESTLSMNSMLGVNDGIIAAENSHLRGDSAGVGNGPQASLTQGRIGA